ncbi:hypothetical protein FRB99_007875 [Tulasnella sp. 403]|nr:hypothetical protein FRB99_007875 [Tulasnella sp. 403]
MAPIFSVLALALFASRAAAAPALRRTGDSAIGKEVAVSASGGVVMSDLAELASQTSEAASAEPTPAADQMAYMPEDKKGGDATWEATTTAEAAATYTPPAEYTTEESWTTTQAADAWATPSYGSGYKNWGGEGYNNCVQQCMVQYQPPAATYTAPAAIETPPTGTTDAGNGATHTVIVAPTQGVLRFIPFAVNASVGDTVRYVWGAGPHTVTESSILNPCNRSSAPDAFDSGKQNKSFVFDHVVKTTDPTFFYCSVPTHCQKGMFGILNPPNGNVAPAAAAASNSTMTVGQYVQTMAQSDSNMAAMWSYVNNQTMNTSAYNWGMNMDMSSMPSEQYPAIAQNAMYSALFFAANPGALESGQGAVDTSGKGLVIPADITQTLAQMGSTYPSGASSAPASGATDVPSNSANPGAQNQQAGGNSVANTNGSGRLASSTVLVAAVAVLASLAL